VQIKHLPTKNQGQPMKADTSTYCSEYWTILLT